MLIDHHRFLTISYWICMYKDLIMARCECSQWYLHLDAVLCGGVLVAVLLVMFHQSIQQWRTEKWLQQPPALTHTSHHWIGLHLITVFSVLLSIAALITCVSRMIILSPVTNMSTPTVSWELTSSASWVWDRKAYLKWVKYNKNNTLNYIM